MKEFKITPAQHLYSKYILLYKLKHGKEPSHDAKFALYAQAQFDYDNMSFHDKMLLDREVKEFNDGALAHKIMFDKSDMDNKRAYRKKKQSKKPKSRRVHK